MVLIQSHVADQEELSGYSISVICQHDVKGRNRQLAASLNGMLLARSVKKHFHKKLTNMPKSTARGAILNL